MAVHHREGIECPIDYYDYPNPELDQHGQTTYDWDAYYAAVDEWYEDLQKVTKEVGNHELSGTILAFPYADGAALYLIHGDVDGQPELSCIHVWDGWRLAPILIDGISWEGIYEYIGSQGG